MFRTALVIIAGATALAAPASETDRGSNPKLDKKLAGLVPGPSQNCISPSPSRSSDNYGNTIILTGRDGVLYRTSFRGGCVARSSDALISRRPTTQLCTGDIIEIQDVQAGIFRGACTYNEFVPYRKPQ